MTTYYTLRIKGTQEYLGGANINEMSFGINGARFTDDLEAVKECSEMCSSFGVETEIVYTTKSESKYTLTEDGIFTYKLELELELWPGDN